MGEDYGGAELCRNFRFFNVCADGNVRAGCYRRGYFSPSRSGAPRGCSAAPRERAPSAHIPAAAASRQRRRARPVAEQYPCGV